MLTDLSDFKSRFEAAGNAETREEIERQAVEVIYPHGRVLQCVLLQIAIDLGNLKAAFTTVSDEMCLLSHWGMTFI